MSPYKLLSLLLQYPTRELLGALPELEADASALEHPSVRQPIVAYLRSLRGRPLHELEREYVATFDFDRRSALHLTYHTHGDRRQRGLVLVRLKRRYAEAGLELAGTELPDYLPVMLEFAALAPSEAGAALLAEHREPLELVRFRLHERGSPYARLLDALVASLPALTPVQRERIERLADEGPPAELVGLEPYGPDPPGSRRMEIGAR